MNPQKWRLRILIVVDIVNVVSLLITGYILKRKKTEGDFFIIQNEALRKELYNLQQINLNLNVQLSNIKTMYIFHQYRILQKSRHFFIIKSTFLNTSYKLRF
jgi:hypothetical protein